MAPARPGRSESLKSSTAASIRRRHEINTASFLGKASNEGNDEKATDTMVCSRRQFHSIVVNVKSILLLRNSPSSPSVRPSALPTAAAPCSLFAEIPLAPPGHRRTFIHPCLALRALFSPAAQPFHHLVDRLQRGGPTLLSCVSCSRGTSKRTEVFGLLCRRRSTAPGRINRVRPEKHRGVIRSRV